MTQPLPPIPLDDQARKDSEHLKLLSIFHFVGAGLALVGIAFLFLHYFIMTRVFANPAMWKQQGPPLPKEVFAILVWVYLFAALFMITFAVLNVMSAIFLRQRRHRTFSLVVAGLNCLHFPLGTTLGVFTFIVLLRESVRRMYDQAREDFE